MYLRKQELNIRDKIGDKRAIIVIGPRRTGKTTLIKKILNGTEHLLLNYQI